MAGKKTVTARRSRRIGSELKKVDAYVLTKADYDEIPELTEADFARGTWHIGGVPVPRGRPKSAAPKSAVSLRLDQDVIAHYRGTGRGWQGRINETLRKAAKLPAVKKA
ncbi:MAG: BrnA antitoxin family protein [Pseudolabrys sp.]|nr:BrnA antitoxin family protein [Pseudolabrys sp.]